MTRIERAAWRETLFLALAALVWSWGVAAGCFVLALLLSEVIGG